MGFPRVAHFVRFVQGSGFEMKCETCELYVPLVEEEWWPSAGLTRCRACWREYHRLHEAGRNAEQITRELKNTNAKLRYAFERPRRLAANRVWREAHKEHIAAYNKAYREKNREILREKRIVYEAECRAELLKKKRWAYADKKAAA